MSKVVTISVIAIVTAAILLVVIPRADLRNPGSDDGSSVAANLSGQSTPDDHADVDSKFDDSAERPTGHLAEPLPESARDDLGMLIAAAKRGDGNAQFRLALIIRECVGLRSVVQGDPLQGDSRFSGSRRALQKKRDRCSGLADDTRVLLKQADEWEARALSAGSTAAKAHKLISELNVEDHASIERASNELKQLISSREPYVYYGLSALETAQSQAITPKAIALRLLACEGDSAPAELCGAESIEIWHGCASDKLDCDSTVTLTDYYYHFYPQLFDSARGYLSEFRDQLRAGRYQEFETLLSSP